MNRQDTVSVEFLLDRYHAKRVEEKLWVVENKEKGWSFYVIQDAICEHNRPGEEATVWKWKIDTQYFDLKESYAADYLARLIEEKNTGIRYIDHPKREVPCLCGREEFLREHENDSWGCRAQTRGHFSMLCSDCPIAEEIQAKHDGVTLQYAKFDKFVDDNTFSHVLHNDTFNIRCNLCGRVVLREPDIEDYPYYCPHCGKNRYGNETFIGDWHTGKELDELCCQTKKSLGLDDDKGE